MTDIRRIPKNSETEDAYKIINELITSFNFLQRQISLKDNFDGQIIENIVFAAGEDKVIPHKLSAKPQYRIILKQEGNGVLSDSPSGWNQYQIKIKNDGAVQVTATIFIVRG